ALLDRGDRPGALTAFERAVHDDPTNAVYWANLGNARRAAGNAAAAEQAYRSALDADARSADAANGLGVLLVRACPRRIADFLGSATQSRDCVSAEWKRRQGDRGLSAGGRQQLA